MPTVITTSARDFQGADDDLCTLIVDAIRRHLPTFTVGAITVFIALSDSPNVAADDLASLIKIASGGAPIAAATTDRFEQRFGTYITTCTA